MSAKPKLEVLLEAVLFASSQPLLADRIAGMVDADPEEIKVAAEVIKSSLNGRGIELVEGPEGYELEVARAVRGQVAKALATQAPPLSTAALEVLTIIAYKQPITKVAIDEVRGIASDASLRALLARDLVVASGKQEGASLYRTTNQFLKVLGLTHIEELPPLSIDGVQAPEPTNAAE